MHLRRKRIQRHITTRRVDHFDNMPPLLTLFHKTASRIIILTAQNSHAQRPFWSCLAHPLAVIHIIAQLRLQKPLRRYDTDMVLKRLPPKQHTVAHGCTVAQRNLNGPTVTVHQQVGLDNIAVLTLPIGGGHFATILDLGRTGKHNVFTSRNRVHHKTHLGLG